MMENTQLSARKRPRGARNGVERMTLTWEKTRLKRTGVVWIERGRGTGCTWTMIRAS